MLKRLNSIISGSVFFSLMLLSSNLKAQGGAKSKDQFEVKETVLPVKQLNIGDKVPDFEIGSIVNYKSSSARISDFKGKLLILDFWIFTCGPCIAALPTMNSLQQKFDGDIQIIPVNPEKKEATMDRLNRMFPGNALSNLLFAVNDSVLRKSLSYGTVPHEVWIDQNGVIIAITDGREVTVENIQKALNGNVAGITMKERHSFLDIKQPLFTLGKEKYLKNLIFQSSIIKGLSESHGSTMRVINQNDRSIFKVFTGNSNIRSLYAIAFSNSLMKQISTNRIILENVKDASVYTNKSYNERNVNNDSENSYLYELMFEVPGTGSQSWDANTTKRALRIMQRDLNNYFGDLYGTYGSIEKRNIKCFIIRTSPGNEVSFKASGGKQEQYRVKGEGLDFEKRVLKNIPIDIFASNFAFDIRKDNFNPIIINEAGYKGNVDIQYNYKNVKDLETARLQLKKYGLDITEEYRLMDVLVITEKNNEIENSLTSN